MVEGINPINDDVNRTSSFGSSETAAALANGAEQLLASAGGGQLVFDPQTGQALLNALQDAFDELSDRRIDAGRIVVPSPLGMTAGGRAISMFNGVVAAIGPNAFVPVHQQFLRALSTAAEAVRIAMDTYVRTEQHNIRSFTPSH
jgi:hypothetical protein